MLAGPEEGKVNTSGYHSSLGERQWRCGLAYAHSEDRGGRESSEGVSMIEYAGFGIKLHEKRESKKWAVMFQSEAFGKG